MEFLYPGIDHLLKLLQVSLFACGDKETIILHLCHPGAHQLLQGPVGLGAWRKVVLLLFNIGIGINLIEENHHRLATGTDICQSLVDHFNLLFKIGM